MGGTRQLLYDHFKNISILWDFGLRTVWLSTSFFLRPTHFLHTLRLAAVLVAKLKADPELSHLAAGQNVWDPLDYKGGGLLLIPRARSDF